MMLRSMWPAVLAQVEGEQPEPQEPPAAADEEPPPDVTDQFQAFFQDLNLGETFALTPWTGWLVLLIAIFVGLAAGKLVQGILRRLSQRMLDRGWIFRGTFLADLAGPAGLFFLTLGLSFGLGWIHIPREITSFVANVLVFLYILAIGWVFYNLVDLIDVAIMRHAKKAQDSKLAEQFLPLIRKTLRIFVVVIFGLTIASNVFGANIGAWLAGLGIAGLAVSLAAQDSIRNLFGSITIFLDKPFAVGDFITLTGHTGTVLEVGFRSTKLRTLTGAIITIPNSKIIDNDVENITGRLNIRRNMNVTITYDTPPEKIEQAVQIVKDILADPEIAESFDLDDFPPRVYFNELNADSLNILATYWFHPPVWWDYVAHAEKVNHRLIRAFNDAGIDFAFPTQTIYLANDEKRQLAVRQLDGDGSPRQLPGPRAAADEEEPARS